jgi:hypothetical protein
MESQYYLEVGIDVNESGRKALKKTIAGNYRRLQH